MAFTFPTSPSNGDTFNQAGWEYVYRGNRWIPDGFTGVTPDPLAGFLGPITTKANAFPPPGEFNSNSNLDIFQTYVMGRNGASTGTGSASGALYDDVSQGAWGVLRSGSGTGTVGQRMAVLFPGGTDTTMTPYDNAGGNPGGQFAVTNTITAYVGDDTVDSYTFNAGARNGFGFSNAQVGFEAPYPTPLTISGTAVTDNYVAVTRWVWEINVGNNLGNWIDIRRGTLIGTYSGGGSGVSVDVYEYLFEISSSDPR